MGFSFKNIVFDLGGVVIDLEVSQTIGEFANLARLSVEEVIAHYHHPLFRSYETGQLTDQQYLHQLRELLRTDADDIQLTAAWNAMLKGIPKDRIELIKSLRREFGLAVLSNTNGIHERKFNEQLKAVSGHSSLHTLFDKVYFSHQLSMRKPDKDIFMHLLDDMGWNAADTLFLDDTPANIDTARNLGMQATLVNDDNTVIRIFEAWNRKA